jgi:hypothetical protein
LGLVVGFLEEEEDEVGTILDVVHEVEVGETWLVFLEDTGKALLLLLGAEDDDVTLGTTVVEEDAIGDAVGKDEALEMGFPGREPQSHFSDDVELHDFGQLDTILMSQKA